jgi:hypothetical protein
MDSYKGLALSEFASGFSFAKSFHPSLQGSWKQVQDPQHNHVIRGASLMRRILLGMLLPALFLVADGAWAQTTAQAGPLKLFKNYFVTGDYVVGGWVKGSSDGTLATGTISIPDPLQPNSADVPPGADIVAAFLYWETVESTSQPPNPGKNGFFNGYAITGSFLPSLTPNAPTSWSSGGCSGSSQGAKTIQGYRADVRPFLPVDSSGKVLGNGAYQVKLADTGTNGAKVPFTLGATLVIIYRVQSPLVALNSIVLYDGTFAPSNTSSPTAEMSQQIAGFYQAAALPMAKITQIVGGGQSNKFVSVLLNGVNLPSLYGAVTNPLPGIYNGSWDNPTWPVNAIVQANDSLETTSVVPAGTNGNCLDWGAVVFSSTVQDTDGDGLLDVWEDNQGYIDALSGQFVALPGANKLVKDVFVEIDYLSNLDGSAGPYEHSHLPKQLALDLVGDASAAQNVRVHFDVGPTNYAGNCSTTNPAVCPDPYIIKGGTGGNAIPESAALCNDSTTLCQFPGTPAVGWKEGFLFVRDSAPLGNFQPGRKDSYHYVLFGHALGTPRSFWTAFGATEQSTLVAKLVSIVNSGTSAVVTIQTPLGLLKPGDCPNPAIPACGDANIDRVTIGGALGQPALNGTYHFTNLSSTDKNNVTTTTFNIATTNTTATCTLAPCVADGTYNFSNESRLAVVYGGPTSSSGHSDVGGGDSIVTFGLWLADDVFGCQADPSMTLAPGQTYCVNQVGTTTAEGGTLLHELGHTNFLTHGGTFFPDETGVVTSGTLAGQYLNSLPVVPSHGLNCNSGFLSSMNYLFQIRGFPDGGIGYSGQTLPDLLETQLNEKLGIGSDRFTGLQAAHFTRWYGPPNAVDIQLQNTTGGRFATRHCDGTAITDGAQMVRVDGSTFSAPIDWNNNLIVPDLTEPVAWQDVNFNGSTLSSPDAAFPGFNDWINLDLRQVDSRANTLGLSSGGTLADLGGGGTLADLGGGGVVGDLGGGGVIADLGGGGALGDLGGGGVIGDLGGGGTEQDSDTANSTVDPPTGLTAVQLPGAHFVNLNWNAPGFGQIRTYFIWRADTTDAPISATNLPTNIGKVTGTPPATTFTDPNVKNGVTYTYFVTAALGKNIGLNSGNQSGPSNMRTITINFSKGAVGQ